MTGIKLKIAIPWNSQDTRKWDKEKAPKIENMAQGYTAVSLSKDRLNARRSLISTRLVAVLHVYDI